MFYTIVYHQMWGISTLPHLECKGRREAVNRWICPRESDVLDHPNQGRYRGQFIYVVEIDEYLYLVPFVTEQDGTRFLKTVIPKPQGHQRLLQAEGKKR